MKRSRDGFAVVLAAALLAAIVLLLLALTLLTRSELRAAAQGEAAEQARRNALLGLRVALGRLQAAAGPDACSTATAERLGSRNPHWTGVWSDTGEQSWLVSGAPADAAVAVTTTGAAANGALLVGPNTTPGAADSVAALWEPIDAADVPGLQGEQTVGRFAYWIGDEGVKGNVGVTDRVEEVPIPTWPAADDPVVSTADRARLRQLVAHRAGSDALDGIDGTDSGFRLGSENSDAARWAQLGGALSWNQLRFHTLGTAQETENYRAFVRRHIHEFSVRSLGVLSDSASGGLRRNFSDLAAPEVPAAVKDLEQFRPVAGRLPVRGGTAASGEPTAQIKPIVTEWALDFVPYREDGGARLLIGCWLRLELWNPFNLPLAMTPAGVADFRVRIGGRRSGGDSGLPVLRASGPAGVAGEIELRNLLGPAREIAVDLAGDIGAEQVVVVECVVEQAWDSGLTLDDPTPGDAGDDRLRIEATDDAGRALRVEVFDAASGGGAEPLTVLDGFPSGGASRQCAAGLWSVPGNAPFGGNSTTATVAALGVSYHWRLDPARASWAEWVDPAAPREAGPDLKGARIEYSATFWKSAGDDPVASARAVATQFAGGELFTAGGGLAAYDFTGQRNLSVAALAQVSAPGERPFGVGNPWGGARNAVFDAAFFNPVSGSWISGQRLPNVRHRVLDRRDETPSSAAEVGGLGAARFLGVEGMFNVNSVSPEAWTVVLGRTVLGWKAADGKTADLENPFYVFAQSAPFAPAAARGVRCFSDEAVQRLARELATRIAARPRPFRSLAEFVNSGVLQEAIDTAGLNTRADRLGDIGGVAPARYSANWLSQAAVLNTLAPLLAVRSDTFTIRVAAETLNPALDAGDPERVSARAWCEAVVQRLPEYVDAGEDAMAWPAALADNRTLGRRFRIVAFRWLGPDDI